MSFLNPVNEPVKRFSSTDAGAPQVNYNTRVAGDVKTVLKACLVTGYGDKASAGWSIVNEVNHVAEFVSPSADMSDYRLGIDDTSTSTTTWYYQYQDERVNPTGNTPKKVIASADKSNVSNGWQLMVTQQGLYLVEIFYTSSAAGLVARLTYFGRVKSALNSDDGKNIGFFNTGLGAASTPFEFLKTGSKAGRHYNVRSHTSLGFASTALSVTGVRAKKYNQAVVDIADYIYLVDKDCIVGQQPGLMPYHINNSNDLPGVEDINFNARPMLKICLAYDYLSEAIFKEYSRVVLISLDYWEY